FAAEKKYVFETSGDFADVFVSEEGIQIHAIVGPQIDPLDNLFDDDADVISLNEDNKENSNLFSMKALKAAYLEIAVTDSSDDDITSFKSVPKGCKRTLTREDQMMKMEGRKHKLRCRSSLLAIKHAEDVHEHKMEILKQFWKKKISEKCETPSAVLL
ncbi:unnamed protein product, partial [Allacma fusca]